MSEKTGFWDKVECDRCRFRFNEKDLDWYDGKLVCRSCEGEMKEMEKLK